MVEVYSQLMSCGQSANVQSYANLNQFSFNYGGHLWVGIWKPWFYHWEKRFLFSIGYTIKYVWINCMVMRNLIEQYNHHDNHVTALVHHFNCTHFNWVVNWKNFLIKTNWRRYGIHKEIWTFYEGIGLLFKYNTKQNTIFVHKNQNGGVFQ